MEDETTPLPLNERSDSEVHVRLVASPMGEGPDTKLIKRKLLSDGSPSDFFIDKVRHCKFGVLMLELILDIELKLNLAHFYNVQVVGDKIKKELSRIQTELCTSNPNLKFS